jgi:peptidoglycan/LPS O-acetylase OafA/YrhL
LGVDIFFVLSGFLITGIINDEIDRTGTINLKRFFIRRALRLTPALWLLLCAAIVLIMIGSSNHSAAAWSVVYAATYLMNWCRALGWGNGWALAHTWSLAIEEQFYLVWPFLLLRFATFGHRLKLTSLLLFIAIGWRVYLINSGASSERIYNGFDTHADSLVIGSMLSMARLPERFERLVVMATPLTITSLLIILFTLPYQTMTALLVGYPLVAMLSVALIISARQPGWFRNVLSIPVLVYCGKISYGIYLWHYLLISAWNTRLPENLAFFSALLSVGVAIISYELVEKRFVKLKDKWAPKQDAKSEGDPLLALPIAAPVALVTDIVRPSAP